MTRKNTQIKLKSIHNDTKSWNFMKVTPLLKELGKLTTPNATTGKMNPIGRALIGFRAWATKRLDRALGVNGRASATFMKAARNSEIGARALGLPAEEAPAALEAAAWGAWGSGGGPPFRRGAPARRGGLATRS